MGIEKAELLRDIYLPAFYFTNSFEENGFIFNVSDSDNSFSNCYDVRTFIL